MVCYDQNLQKHKYLSTISIFLQKTFRTGSLFQAGRNESKQWYAMIKTYKNINISAQYQYFCMKPSEQGSFFKRQSKWVQTVVCYDQNLQKHKYLSTISIFLQKTFRTGLVFPSRSKWVQTVVCYDQNLQKHKYPAQYQYFYMKPSEQGSFFWAGRNESKQWHAMIKTYKIINISAWYQYFCTKPSEQAHFPSRSKWVQTVVCYDQNLQKHKYLSTISMLLHKTFRTGLIFPEVKWVQTVVCYDQNLQKHKYLSAQYQYFCMKPSEQGSFFQASRNESKQWYAMIKTYKNINISAQYQYFCMKPSEQGSFFWASQNESKQWYAMIKTYKNINISAQYQCFCTKPSEQGSFFKPVEMSPNSGMLWSKLTKT